MKKQFIILLMLFISMLLYSDFEKIEYMEIRFFGFELSSTNTYEDRIAALENKILGITSKGDPVERADKLYTLLFLDGEERSLVTKLRDLEISLLKESSEKREVLERLENLEQFLFKKIENQTSFSERIKRLEKEAGVLYKKDQKISNLSEMKNFRIRILNNPEKIKEGLIVIFELMDDIEGVALKGSKIYARVEKKRKKGIFRRKKTVKLRFFKIVNLKKNEIVIDKLYKLKEKKSKYLRRKKLELPKEIYFR